MSVTVSYNAETLTYSFSSDTSMDGRIRLFVWVDKTDFSATPADLYDNWNTDFRPSRIDRHKFNMEVVVPWSGSTTSCTFNSPISTESESYLEHDEYINPINILVEEKWGPSHDIESIMYNNGLVTVVTTDPHCFYDGDAVAIEKLPGITPTGAGDVGPDGLRLRGSFKIHVVDGCTFTYYTAVTGKVKNLARMPGTEPGKVSRYRAIQYEDSPVLLNGNKITYPEGGSPSYDVGDIVSTSTVVNSSVLDVDNGIVTLNVDLPVTRAGEEGDVIYSPRTPSAAVPANYDPDSDNASLYDHTENTQFLRPVLDTYFTGKSSYNQGESVLKCGIGDNKSVACMMFNVGTLDVTDGLSAMLRLFVNEMNYSEIVVTIYQMSTGSWSASDKLADIESKITAMPLDTVVLTNPALQAYNRTTAGITNAGDYQSYVDFLLDPTVINRWVSDDPYYPSSVAIEVTGSGSPYVLFGSNEAEDRDGNFRPQLIITGGEAGSVEADLFDIITTASTVEPGNRLCIMALNEGSFGNAPFNNVVKLGGTPVPIEYGTEDRMYVIVPATISGSVDVVVYRKMNDSENLRQITNPTSVYVKNDSYLLDIKLNDKMPAGVINRKTSRSAMYNRDLGFSNFTEITDETSLIQNVYSILLTRKGERLFNQMFGTRIEDTLFHLGYETTEVDLLKECIEAVEKYEPRVTIDGDRSSCTFDESGTYNLTLCVILPTARQEMVKFTFKNRGQVV